MIKKLFLLTCLSGLISCSENKPVAETQLALTPVKAKPNFVFIFADDQSPKTLGAYGNKEIITPNLDELAKQGVNFSNAHNMGSWTGAVCLASRTMLNSGLSVWEAQTMNSNYAKGKGFDLTWSKLMEKAGYETYMTGKWHVHAPANKVFQSTLQVRPGMPKDNWDHFTQVERFKKFANGTSEFSSAQEFMPVGYNRPLGPDDNSWSPTDPKHGGFFQGGTHWSEVVKNNALTFIEQASQTEKPFFMYLAFNAPHDPRQAPQAYQDLYQAEQLSLPASFQPLYPEKDFIGNGPSLRDAALAPFPRTAYATKVHLKEYYALISHLDTQVGDIISALKASGKMDNTYIVYTADHGLAVGEHGLFGKQNMYDHSVRSPFIIWGPDMNGGNTVDANIYLQDVMATALDLAGVEKPEHIFFNSIKNLATGASVNSYYPAIYGSYKDNQRMIKKDGFKLIVYPEVNKVKLFNLTEDPDEMLNLADNKQYKTTVNKLFKDLLILQKELADDLNLMPVYSKISE
ncbi:MAG: sulfatase-like hydrolase/transferase [Thalassotalea sp.]